MYPSNSRLKETNLRHRRSLLQFRRRRHPVTALLLGHNPIRRGSLLTSMRQRIFRWTLHPAGLAGPPQNSVLFIRPRAGGVPSSL